MVGGATEARDRGMRVDARTY
jgi:hypothetical protein